MSFPRQLIADEDFVWKIVKIEKIEKAPEEKGNWETKKNYTVTYQWMCGATDLKQIEFSANGESIVGIVEKINTRVQCKVGYTLDTLKISALPVDPEMVKLIQAGR